MWEQALAEVRLGRERAGGGSFSGSRDSGGAELQVRRTVLTRGADGQAAGNPGPPCINGCGATLDLGHCKSVCPTCGIWQTCHD
ncbi:MAG: hypothetical protein HY509_00760 [Acidobacteria bacterium]|nr:hypothetical protein [Acidobacteriota bacterium]